MSATDDSYRTAPTRELIDDLLDNRPEVHQKAKQELLTRLANKKKSTSLNWSRWKQTTPSLQTNNWRGSACNVFACRYRFFRNRSHGIGS